MGTLVKFANVLGGQGDVVRCWGRASKGDKGEVQAVVLCVAVGVDGY